MTPVTIHTHARACLRIVWRYPYILGFSLAELYRSNSQLRMFSSELDLILHPQKFSTMNNLQYTVCDVIS